MFQFMLVLALLFMDLDYKKKKDFSRSDYIKKQIDRTVGTKAVV